MCVDDVVEVDADAADVGLAVEELVFAVIRLMLKDGLTDCCRDSDFCSTTL